MHFQTKNTLKTTSTIITNRLLLVQKSREGMYTNGFLLLGRLS